MRNYVKYGFLAAMVFLVFMLSGCGGGGGGGSSSVLPDIVYTTSDFQSGSFGAITVGQTDESSTVEADLLTNLGGDILTFVADKADSPYVFIREYSFGANSDSVYALKLDALQEGPVSNISTPDEHANIHDICYDKDRNVVYVAFFDNGIVGKYSIGDNGEILFNDGTEIDLTQLEDDVHPHRILLIGNNVYVLAQRYDEQLNQYEGVLFVIDAEEFDGFSEIINVGVNPQDMAYYEGKLYITCLGNYGVSDDVLQEVDLTTFDVKDIMQAASFDNLDISEIEITDDGTGFIVAGSYGGEYKIYKCVEEDGQISVTPIKTYQGWVPEILWDQNHNVLWVVSRGTGAGDGGIFGIDKNGQDVYSFDETELNGIPYDIELVK